MTATSKISVTEGSGKNLATNSISEDAVTKELSRIVIDNSAGTEIGTAANPLVTTNTPAATGGLSTFRSLDVDETEEQIKASAGQLYGYYLANMAAAARYFKFYGTTAANVTVGTTTPDVTIPLPAGAAANAEFSSGVAFAAGITIAATTGLADNDTGAPDAGDCIANIFYK
jgi:hypothetical protein